MDTDELLLIAPTRVAAAIERGGSESEIVAALKSAQLAAHTVLSTHDLEELALFYRNMADGAVDDNA